MKLKISQSLDLTSKVTRNYIEIDDIKVEISYNDYKKILEKNEIHSIVKNDWKVEEEVVKKKLAIEDDGVEQL